MKKKLTAVALVVCMLAIMLVGASLAYFTDTDEATNTFTMGNVAIDLTEDAWDKYFAGSNEVIGKLMPGTIYPKDPKVTNTGSEDAYLFLDVVFNKYNSLLWVMAADASADKDINFTIFDENGAVKAEFQNDKGQFSTTNFLTEIQKDKASFQAIINKWFGGIEHTDWQIMDYDMGETNKKCLTVRLGYIGDDGIITAGEEVQFMEEFGMPASVTQEMIESGKTIGGQANTFNTIDAKLNLTFKAYAIQKAELNTLADAYTAMFDAE